MVKIYMRKPTWINSCWCTERDSVWLTLCMCVVQRNLSHIGYIHLYELSHVRDILRSSRGSEQFFLEEEQFSSRNW